MSSFLLLPFFFTIEGPEGMRGCVWYSVK